MHTIWFNHGFAVVRDALTMLRAEAGPALRLLASHRDATAPALRAADLAIVEPRPLDDDGYLAWALELCAREKVDLFVVQSRARKLADHANAFAAVGTRLFTPSDGATLDLIDDKARFYDVALAHGLPMPQTIEVTSPDQFDAALEAMASAGHEACIKPPIGIYGAGYWRLDDSKDLFYTLMHGGNHITSPMLVRQALATRDADSDASPPRLLVLEYLPGAEWSVDALLENGRWITGVAREKRGRFQHLITDGPVIDLAKRCFAPFALNGMNNLQCKAGKAGEDDLRLLEINARMSGGCHYARHADAKLPWWQVALTLGLIDESQLPRLRSGAIVASVKSSETVDAVVIGQGEEPHG